MKKYIRHAQLLAAAISAVIAGVSAADDGIWNKSTGGNYSDPANWSGGIIPNGIDQTATFGDLGASSPVTVTVDGNITLGHILIDAPYAYGLTSGAGSSLTLSSSGTATITVAPNSGLLTTENITAPLFLNSPLLITNGNAPYFDAQGVYRSLTLVMGALAGSQPVTIQGPGIVGLQGNDASYSGAITVNSGVLQLLNLNALNTSIPGVTINGGTLISGFSLPAVRIYANDSVLSVTSNSATLNLSGADKFLQSATFSGPILGTGTLVVSGAAVTTNAANSYAGLVRLSNGSLTVSSSGSFSNAGFDVQAGQLTVNALPGTSTANVPAGSVMLEGGILALGGDINPLTILSPTSTSGALAINVANFTAGGTNILEINTLPSPSTLRVGSTKTGSIAASVVVTPDAITHTLRLGISGASASTLTVYAALRDFNGFATQLDIASGSSIVLGGSNTYSGITTVNGTLQVLNGSSLGLSSGTDADGTVINATGYLISQGSLGDEKITLQGGILSATTSGPILVNGSGGYINGVCNGTISGNGDWGTFAPLTLAGSNTFTGALTIVAGGSVNATSASSLGSTTNGTTIDVGGTLAISAACAEPVIMAGGVFIVNAPYTPNLSVPYGTVLFNVPYAGDLAIGGGTLNGGTVIAAQQTTGQVNISGGVLMLQHGGSSAINMTGGQVILSDAANAYTGSISLANGSLLTSVYGPAVNAVTTFGTAVFGSWGSSQSPGIRINSLTGAGSLIFGYVPGSYVVQVTGPLQFSGLFRQNYVAQFAAVDTVGVISIGNVTTFNGPVQHSGSIFVHSTSVTLNAPTQISGNLLLSYATLIVNSSATAGHLEMTGGSGSLTGAGTLVLADQQIELLGSNFSFTGKMPGLSAIDKNSTQVASIRALPSDFDGTINVQAGELQLHATAGGSTAPISVAASGAQLTIFSGTYANSIYLNGGTGINGAGALWQNTENGLNDSVLAGLVDVGAAGTEFNGLYGSLDFTGTLTGGPVGFNTNVLLLAPATVGAVTVRGVVQMQSLGALTTCPSVAISRGGQLILDNSSTLVSDRLPDSTPIQMDSGRLKLDGKTGTNVNTTEATGAVTLLGGLNTLAVLGNGLGINNKVQLAIASLQRTAGATAMFVDGGFSTGLLGNSADGPHLLIAGQPSSALLGGGYVYEAGGANLPNNFVKYDAAMGVQSYAASDYFTGSEASWASNAVPAISSGSTATLSGSRTISALKIGDGTAPTTTALDLAANSLNIVSGGVLVGGSIKGSAGNRLTAGGASSAELFFHQIASSSVAISANITDNPGPDGQYDSTPGGPLDADNGSVSAVFSGSRSASFILSGTNSYTGGTFVNGASVTVNSAASIGAGPLCISGGGIVTLNGGFTAFTGPVNIYSATSSGAIAGTAKLDAASYAFESGSISIPIIGNGPLVKSTSGSASLGDITGYTGSITVTGGSLSLTGGNSSTSVTIANPITVQDAGIQVTTNTVLSGPIALGENSTLTLSSGFGYFTPSSLTVGNNASLINNGIMNVSGSDPFTDTTDSTRHLNLSQNGNLYLGAGTYNMNTVKGGNFGVSAGTTLVVDNAQLSNFGVSGTFKLRASPAGVASQISTFTIAGSTSAWTGTVDVSNRVLILQASSANKATLLQTTANQIVSGRHGGDWLGNGITSSSAAADPSHYGVALYDNAQLQLVDVDGLGNVDENSIIVSRALLGDANFDGKVDAADLAIVENNMVLPGTAWSDGDLNLDGVVNTADLDIVLEHWIDPRTYPVAFSQDGFSFQTLPAAPEPPTLILLAPLAILILRRRRSPDGVRSR